MDTFQMEFKKIIKEYESHPKDDLMEKLKVHKNKVIVFGAGAVGNSIADNFNINAFCDNHKAGWNKQFNVPIITPKQLVENHKDAVVIVAACYKYNLEMYNQIIKMGFPRENIFRRYSGYQLYSMEKFKQYYRGYEWAYSLFEDDISKKIILDRIRGYLFYHDMPHSVCEDQYFDSSVISFSEDEVFYDAGCYIGDTIQEFIKRVNGHYRHIYGFEPDASNYKQALNNLEPYHNISLIKKGLWNCDDVLTFNSASSASRITENGDASIQLTSVDSFLSNLSDNDKNTIPTFIKMDIEGSEKEAIMGCRETIKKCHPKLAVCVYHRPEDIYEIPKIIMELGKYNFTLRHYSQGDVETVLYAI